jgi:hypothetical protein
MMPETGLCGAIRASTGHCGGELSSIRADDPAPIRIRAPAVRVRARSSGQGGACDRGWRGGGGAAASISLAPFSMPKVEGRFVRVNAVYGTRLNRCFVDSSMKAHGFAMLLERV